MRVLVACEYSGTVRDAFSRRGHQAMSCDLLPSETPGEHYLGDVRDVLDDGWDLMVAHPPCTHLSVSGQHWFVRGLKPTYLRDQALDFVRYLMAANIPRICIENPVSVISTTIRKPDQIVQPFEYGHDASKKTCLWLKGLAPLKPDPAAYVQPQWACMVCKRRYPTQAEACTCGKLRPVWGNQTASGQNKLGPSPDRWKERSRFYTGVAEAMATQWSK